MILYRTGFELIVREHLASGTSVRYLALGQGESFPKDEMPPTTNSIAHSFQSLMRARKSGNR